MLAALRDQRPTSLLPMTPLEGSASVPFPTMDPVQLSSGANMGARGSRKPVSVKHWCLPCFGFRLQPCASFKKCATEMQADQKWRSPAPCASTLGDSGISVIWAFCPI